MIEYKDCLENVIDGLSNYLQVLFTYKRLLYRLLTILIKEYEGTLDSLSERLLRETVSVHTGFRMLYRENERIILDPMTMQVEHYITDIFKTITERESNQHKSLSLPKCLRYLYTQRTSDAEYPEIAEYFERLMKFLDFTFLTDLLELLSKYCNANELRKVMLIHNLLYIRDSTITSQDQDIEIRIERFDRLQYLPPILFNLFIQYPKNFEYFEYFNSYIKKSTYELWKKMFEAMNERSNEVFTIASKAIHECRNQAEFHEQAKRLLKTLNLDVNLEVRGGIADLLEQLKIIYNSVKDVETIFDVLKGKNILIDNFITKSIMENILEFNLSNILVAYGILPLINAYLFSDYLDSLNEARKSQGTELDVFANIPLRGDDIRIYYKPVIFECKLCECEKIRHKKSIKDKAKVISRISGVLMVLCNLNDKLYEFIDEDKIVFVNSSVLMVPDVFIGFLYYIVDRY